MFSFISGGFIQVELLRLFVFFKGTTKRLPIGAVLHYMPVSGVWGFWFLFIFSNALCCLCL